MSLKAGFQLSAVFATRGAGAAGGVALGILIGRLAGPEGLGQFAVFLGFLGVWAILARAGLDIILIRLVAAAGHEGAEIRVPALVRYAIVRTVLLSLIASFAGAVLLESGWFGRTFAHGALIFFFLLPVWALLSVVSGYFKGCGRPWLAPVLEGGGISLLASAVMFCMVLAGFKPDVSLIAVIVAVSAAVVCILSAVIVKWDFGAIRERSGSDSVASRVTGEERQSLRRGRLPFTVIALSGFLVQAGSFVIVAPYLSGEEMGLARAAERLALVISFPVLAINPFISARVVQRAASGTAGAVLLLIGKASLVGAVISLPMLVLMLLFPEVLLGVLGSEFVMAAPYLRLLAPAHFALVMLGPFAALMNMTGGERIVMWVSGVSLVAAAVLFQFGAIQYGVAGFLSAYVIVSVGRAGAIGLLSMRHLKGRSTGASSATP